MRKGIVDLVHRRRCLLLRAGAEARAQGHRLRQSKPKPSRSVWRQFCVGNATPETGYSVSDRVLKTVGGAHKAGVDASGRQYLFSSSRRIHSTGNSGAHVSLVLGSRARRAEPRCGRANLGRRWRSGARGAEKKGSAAPLPVLASRGGDAQSLGAHGRSL